MTVVYTSSGTRYLLEKEKMTITSDSRFYPIEEWPEIEIGKPLRVKILKGGEKRVLRTSDVVGVT